VYYINIYLKKKSVGWSFAKYSQYQQCFQVERPTVLVNSVKHVSIKGPLLRPLDELPGFEMNKIGEQKIEFYYYPWLCKKLKHKRLVKT
jgi:hypothetical protein